MSRRSKRQRFYARRRIARSTPPWFWRGADMTDLIPIGSIGRLIERMQSWPKAAESSISEPDPLF